MPVTCSPRGVKFRLAFRKWTSAADAREVLSGGWSDRDWLGNLDDPHLVVLCVVVPKFPIVAGSIREPPSDPYSTLRVIIGLEVPGVLGGDTAPDIPKT